MVRWVWVSGQFGGIGQRAFLVSFTLAEGGIDFDQWDLARALLEIQPGDVLEGFQVGDAIFAGAIEGLAEESDLSKICLLVRRRSQLEAPFFRPDEAAVVDLTRRA
jgi:hypothetical protein